MAGILYVVGTPIGNLSDLSPRAVETLGMVDFIAAEDTRVTVKLLNHFGIKKPLVSYYEHNKLERGQIILDRILSGESCALVSDAGMPAISDPGELLVAQCAEAGIQVLAVPGPSAVISALAVSGLPTGRFTFEGFLSVNKKSRREHLADVKNERRTMVFYEAPHKLSATLHDMLMAWGDRKLAIVREITKIHEEVIRTTLAQADERFQTETPRGEIVLVIAGAEAPVEQDIPLEEAVQMAREFLAQGMSTAEAAKRAAQLTPFKKGEIYRQLLG
ncbi:MAG: 16S rRNA (cytidine(1402)-2'-O)-methyltransferase [Oscillospiraceae bacterium]|nr:16S rRNA (cytidine(1402)-2'-O)-methyltransferase [Oscillospiraceae bacterium]